MQKEQLALIIEALINAVHNLEKRATMLKVVSKNNNSDQSFLLAKHNGVIHRLDGIISHLRAVELDSSMQVQLDQYQLFSVNKAVNEQIMEHENALAYFSQMDAGVSLIVDFQKKIEALHMAVFAINYKH